MVKVTTCVRGHYVPKALVNNSNINIAADDVLTKVSGLPRYNSAFSRMPKEKSIPLDDCLHLICKLYQAGGYPRCKHSCPGATEHVNLEDVENTGKKELLNTYLVKR